MYFTNNIKILNINTTHTYKLNCLYIGKCSCGRGGKGEFCSDTLRNDINTIRNDMGKDKTFSAMTHSPPEFFLE